MNNLIVYILIHHCQLLFHRVFLNDHNPIATIQYFPAIVVNTKRFIFTARTRMVCDEQIIIKSKKLLLIMN